MQKISLFVAVSLLVVGFALSTGKTAEPNKLTETQAYNSLCLDNAVTGCSLVK